MSKQQTILMMRMAGAKPKKRKRLIPIKYPFDLEITFAKHLRSIVLEFVREVIKEMTPEIEPAIEEWKQKTGDAIIEREGYLIGRIDPRPEQRDIIEDDLIRISNRNKANINRQMESALGINPLVYEPKLEAVLQAFVVENVDLIKSLNGEVLDKSTKIIKTGVTQGLSRGEISGQLQDLVGLGTRRANLIARDQVGKFYGQLTKQRHKEIGIEEFIWTTANDDKVRDSHEILDGETFTWEKGADGIYPGSEIQCRCIAQAVLTDIIKEVENDS